MIISLHNPKTAGTTFNRLLRQLGIKVKIDSESIPKNLSLQEAKEIAETFDKRFNWWKKFVLNLQSYQCIHGHFMPYKYRSYLKDEKSLFITWLRDPTERIISHYYQWKREYGDLKTLSVLHRRVVQGTCSLQEFCFSEEMKNIYSKLLWRFPLDNFDFVGITEHYEEDIRFLMKEILHIDQPVEIQSFNLNPDKKGAYTEDIDFSMELKVHLAEDYKIYNQAVEKRLSRI